jgi:hypothetical protein
MRAGDLDYEEHREYADDLLRDICLLDGMLNFRAWYVHKAVRLCSEKYAKPTEEPRDTIICIPETGV